MGGGAVHSVPVHVRYSFGGSSLVKFHTYTQVSAGRGHTVLLHSDGNAVACGQNSVGQCTIPLLDEGMSYTGGSFGICSGLFSSVDWVAALFTQCPSTCATHLGVVH